MTTDSPVSAGSFLSPEAAFSLVGDETRIEIIRCLSAAGGPLSFSALRECVGALDSGRFNYHLKKLTGTFVAKTDDGYELRQSGRMISEAILSGTLTENPVLKDTVTEDPCPFCGAPVEIGYRQGSVSMFCTACDGAYGRSVRAAMSDPFEPTKRGYLGRVRMPPAGLHGRGASDVLRAARTWSNADVMSMAAGVCPRCAAPVDVEAAVCADHDAVEGPCAACGHRRRVMVTMRCVNCRHEVTGPFVFHLSTDPGLLSFLTGHGLSPYRPTAAFYDVNANYEEDVVSVDPLELRFRFEIDGDAITLTVDDDLNVTGTARETRRATD